MAEIDVVYAFMRRQFGLITRVQALECGLTPRQIAWLVTRGRWRVVRPDVYEVAGSPPTWEQSVLAAVLAGGEGVAVSHGTAGRLRTLKHALGDDLEIVGPLGRHKRLDGVVGHRSGALFDSDLTVYRSIPTTTVARTLIDVSGRLSERQLGQAIDDALRRRILDLGDLRRTAGRLGSAPGRSMRKVHRALALRLPGYDPLDSDLETRALRVIAAAGLPVPRQQHPIMLAGVEVHLDLAYPDARLAIELDGWDWHRGRSAFDDDRWRDAELVKLRWMNLRLTAVMSDQAIADVIAAALADRLLTRAGPAVSE
jgi:very-short-patch-repair endonuclease